ncbi:hypothetical protein M569_15219 [Genlisea aurea]|uniref:Uncharacterized protein n=1 Tax=Genlisea aurea TaxID=192259 RepID=S8BYA1_9LAMI|nr:hypothetical protein M569_15219 [Genlisea aurea]
MEPLWKLVYLLEPSSITIFLTAIVVCYASASRALSHGKEMEKNRDLSEASITLDKSQALMIPLMSSLSLLLMFYLFSSVSQLLTAFTAIASVTALYFCLSPYAAQIKSRFGLSDPYLSRCCTKPFTLFQSLLLVFCIGLVAAWLVSGHWILNNILGVSLCIAFVSHVRLQNIKICAMLLVCLFVYDIFWVFYSERIFGANVMVSVATQQASNPVHTVANSLSLPGLDLITKKLELPVKIVVPRNVFGSSVPGNNVSDYMMLGLGDMAIPSMLLALVLCFDHVKSRNPKGGFNYFRSALFGYAVGLVTALAAGVLTRSPQPALLYLVPCTLGPVIVLSWMNRDFVELWEGNIVNVNEKSHVAELSVTPLPQWTGLKYVRAVDNQCSQKNMARKRKCCKGKGVYASLFGVGAPEILVIGVVALLVFGPKGLAEVARNLGKTVRAFQPTIRELQDVSREFKSTLQREIGLDEVSTNFNSNPTETAQPKDPSDDLAERFLGTLSQLQKEQKEELEKSRSESTAPSSGNIVLQLDPPMMILQLFLQFLKEMNDLELVL